MTDILLFPFNGNAKEAIAVIEAINPHKWNIIGFVDDNQDKWNMEFSGYRVLGGKNILLKYPEAKVLAVPGRPENYRIRDQIIASLNIPEERFATLIHPSAQIASSTKIGYNTLIMAGVVTTANVTIGNNCVILPNTVISHDSVIEDYSLIGSNVSISGGVHIKPKCYIGTGSKIIQEIVIEKETLIGIGSVVLKSTEPGSTIAGNPGKAIQRKEKCFLS